MIRFRPLAAEDFPLLLDWLRRPHVKQWWDDGDDTLAKVAAHYGAADGTRRFIAETAGIAVGYFQYWHGTDGEIGCDQFLADPENLSKGVGTASLQAFVDLIVIAEAPSSILVDPHPTNGRAIRCYEKCGFIHDSARSHASVYAMSKEIPQASRHR